MGVRELQAEAKRRDLGTSRSKAELIQRLTAADEIGGSLIPAEDAPAADHFPQADAALPSAGPFRQAFPAGPEGPGEDEHLAYRQATIQAAIDAGCTVRGDAYRTGTVDGFEVYEVRVRAGG